MATFTGTNAAETIAPGFVSPTGGAFPSAAVDIIDAGGGNDTVDGGVATTSSHWAPACSLG